MRAYPLARLSSILAVAALGACGGATGPERAGPAAIIRAVSGGGQTAVVASVLPTPLVVIVTDAQARPVPSVAVTWSVTSGNGVITPSALVTDANGTAQAVLSLGTVAGDNQVSASVTGVSTPAMFLITGTAGPLAKVVASTHALPLCVPGLPGQVGAATTDLYGNTVTGTVSWVSRNPASVTVDNAGNVQLLSPTVGGYVVASSGAAAPDSVYVSPAPVVTPGAGSVNESLPASTFCVESLQPGSEFALVAYNGSPSVGTSTGIQVQGNSVAAIGSGADLVPSVSAALMPQAGAVVRRNTAFEYALRERERREMPQYVASARGRVLQQAVRRSLGGVAQTAPAASTAPSTQITDAAQVGDLVQLNSNANAYCTNPTMSTGRVAAISNSAIVVADTANPANGFTDAEYLSFAVAMDTLVNPVDTTAFGVPYPLGGNKRTVIFFTKAVNQLTTDPSQGVVLGFYYERDLLDKTTCPGSNYANMFYLVVPDPAGTINGGNSFTKAKAKVASIVVSTIGHEYQHLINASRRMYVLKVPASQVNEVTWLNEGLSHIAEDLIFYRAAGLGPRQNIGPAQMADPLVSSAFTLYESGDFSRYQTYLTSPETHAPVGASGDDNLQLRGAIESFLRYAADQQAPTDGNFWYRLVNDTLIGMPNLQHVLGTDPAPVFRRWATSVFTDDFVPGVPGVFTQPSWNWRAVMPMVFTSGYSLLTHSLTSAVPVTATLTAGGVSFFRFAVPSGQRSLVSVTGAGGGALAPNIQLTLVRTK